MKTLLFCLAAGLPLAAGQPPLPAISLYTGFEQQPPSAVMASLQLEVHTIMAPMGLTFRWMSLSDEDVRLTSVDLAVITFRGRCDVQGLTVHEPVSGPLGWTHISDGVILPFADVDCSAVRGFLEKELFFMRPERREQIFGRALGRVLAHELYHILANTTHHGSDGVAREVYRVQDLLTSDFQFEARESDALMTSKAHAALVRAWAREN